MIRLRRSANVLLLVLTCLSGGGCQLRRPVAAPARMIEPQVLEPPLPAPSARPAATPGALPVRLLDTQARGHVGRRILHQQPNGELTEDPVWRWSSSPDRYLDTALRVEMASNPEIRLVDNSAAPTLSATLLVWDLESEGETRLAGAVQFQFTGTDRVVHEQMVRGSEPVSSELPGNVAAAAGRLLRRLASEGVQVVVRERQARPDQ